jgi:hypothetical protein
MRSFNFELGFFISRTVHNTTALLLIMSSSKLTKIWLVASNFITAAAWGRVALIIAVAAGWESLSSEDPIVCSDVMGPAVSLALFINFIEVFNSVAGFTRSPLPAVLL